MKQIESGATPAPGESAVSSETVTTSQKPYEAPTFQTIGSSDTRASNNGNPDAGAGSS